MPGPNRSSSVYSDSFDLEGLLRDLETARDSTVEELEGERDALWAELAPLRSASASMYQAVAKAAEIATTLSRIHDGAQRTIDIERKKRLANSTVI